MSERMKSNLAFLFGVLGIVLALYPHIGVWDALVVAAAVVIVADNLP